MECIKKVGRVLQALRGFSYDLVRYVRFSGWSKNLSIVDIRAPHVLKVLHAVEKSMSFVPRSPRSGWENAHLLLQACRAAQIANNVGPCDRAAITVLEKFVSLRENQDQPEALVVRDGLRALYLGDGGEHGVKTLNREEMRAGCLDNPEAFFLSRHSLRNFAPETVPLDVIERAVRLASRAPSACNRQPWKIYHTTDPEIRDAALDFQSGNRGFGHKIPNLLLITVDLSAFMPGEEHYQHWIDGGIFAMALIHALHALGLGSCCLNWCVSPARDRGIRRVFKIAPKHTILMMLAVGYPLETNVVCASVRVPTSGLLIELERVGQK